jgi:signal transduction histidine kinase
MRAMVETLEARAADSRDLGLSTEVEAHLTLARTIVNGGERYLGEVEGGATAQTAPSTPAIVAAAGQLMNSQGQFSLASVPVREDLNAERNDAIREAKLLLAGSAGVAVLIVGTLVVLDNRRVLRFFAHQEARRESAERLAAHRGDVVNMASHELRNPLTVLTLSTGMITRAAEQRNDRALTELAQDAHVAALRCQSLVNELLDLGRLDADRLQLHLGATPLLPALHDAVAMSEAHHGSRKFAIDGARDIKVSADEDRLRVILRNLVDNAYKYSPAGSRVTVTIREWEGRVRVDVEDEGEGVPPAYRERIFERFERVSGSQHISGVGIGLYLSRELARRMNGDLRLGEREHGASFGLELPGAA